MNGSPVRPAPPRGVGDVLAAACAGAAALVVEIAVVRAVAPWFGQGPYVWANAVGVTLLALALGAAVGGRWAARDPDGRALPWATSAAALWLASAASLVAPLAAWLVPVDVAADRPLPLSLWASLVATVVVLGPPVVVLGAVPPVLVARARGEAGRAAGRLSAAGTLGALLGCAATGPWLVPSVGSRGALAVGGVLAAVVALGTARPVRSRGRGHANAVADARCRAPVATLVLPAIAGLLVTVLEFTAFRALTPAVGGTNATFAASIAAVMAATALGAWWGGGSPAGAADRRRLRYALVAGFVVLPLSVRLATATAGSVGAFPAALLGFGPALFAAGAIGPVSVRLRILAGDSAGRAAGAVLAASTAASLAGCYLTPLVLLPELGVRWTCLVTMAAGLAATGWLRWLRGVRTPAAGELDGDAPEGAAADVAVAGGPGGSPRTGPRVLVAGCILVACVVAVVTRRGPLRHDEGQVDELESAYQTVRSVETREVVPVTLPGRHPLFGGEREVRTRFLRFDEDATSYQSVALPDDAATLLTAGRYYDHLALGAWFDGMPWTRPQGTLRVLVVGYCGGTLHRTLRATAPAGRRVEVVGVELDPAVTALARRHLGPFPEGLELYEGRDAREVLDRLPDDRAFDLVLVDAYQRTQYVPFQLATVEFFRAVRDRLARHGAVAINLNAPDGVSGALLDAVAASLAKAFGGRDDVWLVPNLQYTTNAVVWGTLRGGAPRLAADVPAALLVPAFTFERFLVRSTRAGIVLTDDRAPVEQLADEALLPVKGIR
ncbi:MAG: fused MFS/spermidine synthase [Planctomycetota bacterium]